MTTEDLDRIKRAEEIQRYTENRCDALEKENAELRKDKVCLQDALAMQIRTDKAAKEAVDMQLIQAKGFLKWFVWYFEEGRASLVPYKDKLTEVKQFLSM